MPDIANNTGQIEISNGRSEDVSNSNEGEKTTMEDITNLEVRATKNQMKYLDIKIEWHERSIEFYAGESHRMQEELTTLKNRHDNSMVLIKEVEEHNKKFATTQGILQGKQSLYSALERKHTSQLIGTRNERSSAEEKLLLIEKLGPSPETVPSLTTLLSRVSKSPPTQLSPIKNPYLQRRTTSIPPAKRACYIPNVISPTQARKPPPRTTTPQGRDKRAIEDEYFGGLTDEDLLNAASKESFQGQGREWGTCATSPQVRKDIESEADVAAATNEAGNTEEYKEV
jgi:hypothetical protein